MLILGTKKVLRFFFQSLTVLIFTGLILVFISGAIFFFFIVKDLPSVEALRNFKHANGTEVFSSDGKKIGEFSKARRYRVDFSDLPKHVINAFIAAEDSRFYEHRGVDPTGILRAMILNLIKGRYAQGGSTITQQVARSIVLGTRQKNIIRKIKEILLAWKLEKELSKNEILVLYLNEIYLGHGAFGIGAAARNYFNKTVSELTIAEAALLAGLPQRPNDWDPFHNPLMAKRRQEYVLKRMEEERFITETERIGAWQAPLKLYVLENFNAKVAPYFTEHIRVFLMNKYGAETVLTSGFKVYTTLNYEHQKEAEKAIELGLREIDKRLGYRGVAIHLESDMEIFAMLSKIHDEIMSKVSNVRLFEPLIDPTNYRLAYDFENIRSKNSPYYGSTPIKEGEYYEGVVVGVDEKYVYIKIGQTDVLLDTNGVSWVSSGKIVLTNLFLKGDVVEVKVEKIDRISNSVLVSLEQKPEIQGALLSVEVETGRVLAMVGGRDFEESKFNCATQAKRQVGSTYKPILYAAAIDQGYSPSSLVNDSPIVFKFEGDLDADIDEEWKPQNFGEKFKGEIPLRTALIRSMNVPTVKVLNQISIDYAINYTRRFGITAPMPRDLSIGLGSWSSSLEELLRAYAVFPRQGRILNLTYIDKILSENNEIVTFSEENSKVENILKQTSDSLSPDSVISPQTAFVITDMLRGVVREGTGWRAKAIGRDVAGKTGTSNDHRDAWFIGFIPQLITGVWIGYEKDKPLHSKETGGRAAAPIWVEYMKNVVDYYPKIQFSVPDKVVFAYVDRNTGRLADLYSSDRVRVAFKEGTVPNKEGSNVLYIGGESDAGASRLTTGESLNNNSEMLEPDADNSIKDLYQ